MSALKMKVGIVAFLFVAFSLVVPSLAVESGIYRLLSIAITSKMILVSQIPNKTKYLLDASTAKITVDGKPAEFTKLEAFSIVKVKFELKKSSKDGIELDGIASEISISSPEAPK